MLKQMILYISYNLYLKAIKEIQPVRKQGDEAYYCFSEGRLFATYLNYLLATFRLYIRNELNQISLNYRINMVNSVWIQIVLILSK